jgi:uncharacterized membrane protein
MTKSYKLSSKQIALGFTLALITTNALIGIELRTQWWLLSILVAAAIVLLPGMALMRALRITLRTLPSSLVYCIGLGLLVLMVSGLIANQTLHAFGIQRPLELAGILGTWDCVTTAILVAGAYINKQPSTFRVSVKKPTALTSAVAVSSLVLPCLVTFGAFRLNNGGDAAVAELALGFAAVLIATIILLRHRISDGLIMWTIFIIGLSILFMTSLRGWDIVGHDIEREFHVYTLTHLHAYWDMALDRDPYNACLSITILPQVFAKMLNTSGLIIFKCVLQFAFALCPVVIYILLRQYVSKLGAITASILFICYPTFINDSAMLTRQGVAYLFFALALLIISNKLQRKRYKVLFAVCALGAILSHYSTAYMFVALFAVAVVCKLSLSWREKRRYKKLGIAAPKPAPTVLSPLFAGMLFMMTFIWYTQVTATSGGLLITLNKSLANIPKLFSDDNRSSDASAALLFSGAKSQADLYQSYLEKTPAKNTSKVASALQFLPALTDDTLPLTPLGKKAISVGISPTLLTALRQNFAKVMQLLALIGVAFVGYRFWRRKRDALGPDFVCLSIAGVFLLGLMVALPVLSVNYGILRAFQQALIFLLLPMTLVLIAIARRIWNWLITTTIVSGLVVLFLLFTGMFAQLLGGVSPSLTTSNSGLYYGLFYTSEADARAFSWLKTNVPGKSDVRAANFTRAVMHDPSYPFKHTGILPTQTTAASVVYADPAQIRAQRFYLYYQSSPLTLTFPQDYYETMKNQIYSTTSTRIYK